MIEILVQASNGQVTVLSVDPDFVLDIDPLAPEEVPC
jgi:hypothetical protein